MLKREDGSQNFWKKRFTIGLPKLVGEKILVKLHQHFGCNDISFHVLIFGQIFRVVKSERLILCNKLKLKAKNGLEGSQYRQEMGPFCEAFYITKIQAPSFGIKKAKKASTKRFRNHINLITQTLITRNLLNQRRRRLQQKDGLFQM